MSKIYRAAAIRVSHYYVPDIQFRAGLTTVLRAGWLDAMPSGDIQRTNCPGDDILYCLSGRGRIETETHNFDLGPGQLAWIAGDKPHGHFADECEPGP